MTGPDQQDADRPIDPQPTQDKPGVRIGRMYFVPEIRRTSPDDPWAHRKGEPRLFALFWCIFLMLSALLTLFAVRNLGAPTSLQHQRGAKAMLTLVVVGICVLWPLTRLSQASPERQSRATLFDLLVLLLPVQGVVWPMPILTNWRWSVVGGLVTMLCCWTLLIGAIVRLGLTSQDSARRLWAMTLCLIVVGAAPLVWIGLGMLGATGIQGLLLASPLSAIHALTSAPSGFTPSMTRIEWLAALAPAALALFVFMSATLTGAPPGDAKGR